MPEQQSDLRATAYSTQKAEKRGGKCKTQPNFNVFIEQGQLTFVVTCFILLDLCCVIFKFCNFFLFFFEISKPLICFVLIDMVLFSVCNRIIIKHKTAANAHGLSSIVFIFQIQISNWFSSIILNWKYFIAKVRIMYSINFVSFQVVNFIFNRYVFVFSSSFFSPLTQLKINGRVCHVIQTVLSLYL